MYVSLKGLVGKKKKGKKKQKKGSVKAAAGIISGPQVEFPKGQHQDDSNAERTLLLGGAGPSPPTPPYSPLLSL